MENQYQKWVNISYLALAVSGGLRNLFKWYSDWRARMTLEAKFRSIDLSSPRSLGVDGRDRCLPFCTGITQANQFHERSRWLSLSRVTWPTQKETTNATTIVILMVLISGMVLGLF